MPTKSVRVIERAIDVLEVIRSSQGAAGVSEISKELGLSKSTVHRILVALSNKAIVRRDTLTDRYSFGYKTLELAFGASRQWSLINVATPYLEQLRDQANETAALALKVGPKHSYVAQAMSGHEYQFTPTLGKPYPLHWSAVGKAMLAFVPDDELAEYLRGVPLDASATRITTDQDALLLDLARIRDAGYALSFGERAEGAGAVAAPLRNRPGFAYAAICLIGPEQRIRQKDMLALATTLVEVSRKIEAVCQATGIEGLSGMS